MQLSGVFVGLGEDRFRRLLKAVSMGKLRTYQLFDRVKYRTHLTKLSSESLQKAAPKLWTRLKDDDQDLATDLSQAILVCHMDMIVAVLNFLGVPHEEGFFSKEQDPKQHLTADWQSRAFEQFRGQYDEALLLFYLNHLASEFEIAQEPFVPAA